MCMHVCICVYIYIYIYIYRERERERERYIHTCNRRWSRPECCCRDRSSCSCAGQRQSLPISSGIFQLRMDFQWHFPNYFNLPIWRVILCPGRLCESRFGAPTSGLRTPETRGAGRGGRQPGPARQMQITIMIIIAIILLMIMIIVIVLVIAGLLEAPPPRSPCSPRSCTAPE